MESDPVSKNSDVLQAAIDREFAGQPSPSPEEYFQAIERAYEKYGDTIFDLSSPGDLLVRSFVLAEAEERRRRE